MKIYHFKLSDFVLPLAFLMLMLAGCEPFEENDVDLGGIPSSDFSVVPVPGDPNRFLVEDLSSGSFLRNWDFGNGVSSDKASDTAYYPFEGDYLITLTVAARGGTDASTQSVNVNQTDPNLCDDEVLINLIGGCDPGDSKTWTFSTGEGAITVGPTPGSGEWFVSAIGGLVPEQYDDSFVFSVDGNGFLYVNNGLTVFPENNYEPTPFTPPTDATWALSPGTGMDGTTQLILPEGSFMGVKDSGPIYDIISVTADQLVLQSPILDAEEGYFTLYFAPVP